ncbi:enoyl-CoA hydratase-related protein [Nocardia salmonicida]|uniref:enoyl-CoA hydratase-related protein n=1 Tax=Nocardia salmonicida TaxID=53431 RepID=UPI0039A7122E
MTFPPAQTWWRGSCAKPRRSSRDACPGRSSKRWPDERKHSGRGSRRRPALTIDRRPRRNAIDLAALTELGDRIRAAADRPSVRVIVLTGAGTAFCTGADLAAAAAADGNDAAPKVVMDSANSVIHAIIASPLPVIARVNGPAAGVGASIALAADLVYAADSAYLWSAHRPTTGCSATRTSLPRTANRTSRAMSPRTPPP